MRFAHLVLLRLSVTMMAAVAQAEFSDWDPLVSSSNALAPDQFDIDKGEKTLDIFPPQAFDPSLFSSDFSMDVGSLSSDYGSSNDPDPMLFANVPPSSDTCFSFSTSPLLSIGKARRRRGNNPNLNSACSPSEGGGGEILPSDEIPDLSGSKVEELAKPGEFEQSYCTNGGLFAEIAFLVCSSGSLNDVAPVLFRGFTLYHSTRGTLIKCFFVVVFFGNLGTVV